MRKNQSNVHPAAKNSLRLDWATHEAAKFACENWHYSGGMPFSKAVRIGVWESGEFKGVIIFSMGASPNLLKPYGLKQTEGCELIRIALRDHVNSVSRMISIAIRLLKKKCPGLRLIVSFADPSEGHIGGIYQAGNWLYAGKSSPDRFYRDGDGREYHARQVAEGNSYKKRVLEKRIDAKKLIRFIKPGKYRYLFPLDEGMRTRVKPLLKSYPKRVVSKENVAGGFQPSEGGVIPTTALQNV